MNMLLINRNESIAGLGKESQPRGGLCRCGGNTGAATVGKNDFQRKPFQALLHLR